MSGIEDEEATRNHGCDHRLLLPDRLSTACAGFAHPFCRCKQPRRHSRRATQELIRTPAGIALADERFEHPHFLMFGWLFKSEYQVPYRLNQESTVRTVQAERWRVVATASALC